MRLESAPLTRLHVAGQLRIDGVGSTGSNTRILTVDGSGNVRYRDAGNWTYAGQGDNLGNHTATTQLNMNNQNIVNANIVSTRAESDYDKLRVYSSSNYTIGMHSAMTMGGLNDWAMTFTMNNDADRGFIWRDVSDSQADGAMALTTNGHLTVKSRIDVGTSAASGADLYLADRMIDWDNTGYYVDPNGASRMNEIVFDDGSVSDPSVTWSGDGNTGFYQRIDNEMNVSINGVESTRWETDGDIRVFDHNFWDVNNLTVNTIYDEEDGQIDANDQLAVQVYAKIDYDDNNEQGSALDIGANGLFLQQTASESSGFASNGDRAAIWAPGDGTSQGGGSAAILTIYDEDGMDIDFWFQDNGRLYADAGYSTFSDGSIKKNIRTISSGLEKVMSLRGVTYDLKDEFGLTGDIKDGKEIDRSMMENINGFIAQELKDVIPEVVEYHEDRGLYSVNYDGVIPVLVEAIKEQQAQIESLNASAQQKELKSLRQEVQELKRLIEKQME